MVGVFTLLQTTCDCRASCYYFIVFICNIQTSAARFMSLGMSGLYLIFSMKNFKRGIINCGLNVFNAIKNAASSAEALVTSKSVALSTFTCHILCQRTKLFCFSF